MSLLMNYLLSLPHLHSKANALCDEHEKISFRTLFQQTQRLVNGLAKLPLQPGDRVLVAPLPMRWALVVTYACWWLGLVVVPVTPRYLREENLALLNELEASAVVADTNTLLRLLGNESFECPDILLRPPKNKLTGWWNGHDQVRSLARLSCKGETPLRDSDDALVYMPMNVGKPFVLYSQSALLQQIKQLQQALHPVLQALDTPVLAGVPLWHSFGFAAHVLLLPSAGIASFLPQKFNRQTLQTTCLKHKLSAATGVVEQHTLPIKHLFLSGSYLSKDERQQLPESSQVHLAYGCRESGPAFATGLNNQHHLQALSGSEFSIRNNAGDKVDIGEVGDLYIRGPQLFSGYWRRPNATRKVMQDGWLATGDLARRSEGNTFSVLGRRSQCFQVAGDWVIAPVMERQLKQALAIEQARVEPIKINEITVVKLTVSGEAVNITEIETYCRLHFAGHLVPKVIDVVTSIEADPLGNVIRQDNQIINKEVV
ncbi:AMP-binding protein [Salinibius halmophilus]|uniref:AMP-binding protein n=1 Tax=Salinibius halmophilus TaxID=1853216 RepID=UPI000E663FEA|nr:class I adenylate-forming enzyme family protein [Salinibius halmophilus]